MADETQGYENGDECPECGDGIVTIRNAEHIEEGETTYFEYAQCSRCSWNTFPD